MYMKRTLMMFIMRYFNRLYCMSALLQLENELKDQFN